MKIRKRQILVISSGILLCLGVLILLLPYWLPAIGRPVAKKLNVTWAASESNGWTSFNLKDVSYSHEKVRVAIDELTIPQPLPWLAQRWGSGNPATAQARQVTIEVIKRDRKEAQDGERKGLTKLHLIEMAILEALPWIPNCTVESLIIQNDSGEIDIALDNLGMEGRAISGHLPRLRGSVPPLNLRLWMADDHLRLSVLPESQGTDLRLNLLLNPGPSTPHGSATLYSKGTPLNADLSFSPNSWVPDSIKATARQWPVPVELLPWEQLNGIAMLSDIDLDIVDGTYSAGINLSGTGNLPNGSAEELSAKIHLRGNNETIEVSALKLETDWINAQLQDPVQYSIVGKQFLRDGEFNLQADLNRQTLFPAKGIIAAKATVRTRTLNDPELEFSLTGQDLKIKDTDIPVLAMNGSLDYPLLVVESVEIDLGEASDLSATGTYELESQHVSMEGNIDLNPEILSPYLGTTHLLSAISADFALQGPLGNIDHRGSFDGLKVVIEGLHPITLSAQWQGNEDREIILSAFVSSDNGGRAKFDLEMRQGEADHLWQLTVERADIEHPAQTLVLEEAVSISLDLTNNNPLQSISPFRFIGEQTNISGEYNGDPQLIIADGTNFNINYLESWITRPLPDIQVDKIEFSSTQLRPFLQAEFTLSAHGGGEVLDDLNILLLGSTDASGIHLESIQGSLESQPFVAGDLGLPILLHPLAQKDEQSFSTIEGRLLQGSLEANLSKEVAAKFPEFPFVGRLPEFQAKLKAEGTPESPGALLEVSLSHLDVLRQFDQRFEDIPLENIVISAHLSQEQIEISRFQTSIKGGTIELSGTFASPKLISLLAGEDSDWTGLLASSQIEIALRDFTTKAFASILPDYLRPTGQLSGNLKILPKNGFSGKLELQNFSLRPTLYSQTVNEIHMDLDLNGWRMDVLKAGASVGNSSVKLTGHFDLTDLEAPQYALHLQGERTPLIRTPDILLHSDIDLHLEKIDPNKPTIISGSLGLRDGILLMDFDPMAARTSGQSLPSPPFFNITQQPFSEWILDVDVSGEDFLRFRSAYIRAYLSTQMDLTGTLALPVWVGNVFSSEGNIDFPGLRMSLSRSEFYITRERQDTLQLDINAIGQVASYVVSLAVEGSMDDPHVEFASTPDLGNTQILQLLATGGTGQANLSSVGLYLGKGLFNPGTGNSLWDRITIEFGRDVSETSKDTLDLYYDISDRLRFHGQYDKYDAQNLNLEWEVFSR